MKSTQEFLAEFTEKMANNGQQMDLVTIQRIILEFSIEIDKAVIERLKQDLLSKG